MVMPEKTRLTHLISIFRSSGMKMITNRPTTQLNRIAER